MTQYAKLISNTQIQFPPKNKGSVMNYNLNIDMLIVDGYKEFIEAERPETNRFYHIEYVNNIDNVAETIVYDETQEEADLRELSSAREQKTQENDIKADEKRYNQKFSIEIQGQECVFDTSAKTQSDLLTAFAVCSQGETYDGWITNNGVELDLTLADVVLISNTFKELSNVYPKWKEYKEAIESASTIVELEAIDIDYSDDLKGEE